MIHTSLPRSCVVFLLLRERTRSAITGRPCLSYLCRSLYSTFTTSFYPYAFYNKRLQTLFIDQLVRSKAMCCLGLQDLGTFCNKKHNVHRFTLSLHSLKIMIVESLPSNYTFSEMTETSQENTFHMLKYFPSFETKFIFATCFTKTNSTSASYIFWEAFYHHYLQTV